MSDDLPITDVDAIKSYIDTLDKMIEWIESGRTYPADPPLDSLKEAREDMKRALKQLSN
jgi:hypothetical protein